MPRVHAPVQGLCVLRSRGPLSLGVVACVLAITSALPTAAQAQSPVSVPTLRLQASSPGSVLQWDGVIQPLHQSTVASQVAGNIVALLVKAGDTVKAGQVLARIDERDTQASLNRSQADLDQAQAMLTNARLQWERSQQLKAQGFISDAALDSAQAQWRAAQATVAAAQAERAQAALAKAFATITAPFDGRILSTQAEVGDLAAPGRAILMLYAPQAMRAVVQVPASQSALARSAKVIDVWIPQGGPDGQAVSVHPIQIVSLPGADPVSQTTEWRLDLPPTNALPGQTVQVRFAGAAVPASAGAQATAKSNALTVPAQAVLQRGELTAVYVVREGRFMLQAVRTSTPLVNATQVTLLSGVKPGDVIALDAIKAGLANATPAKP
jgi:RND family efflux transporter MFP subunit